LSIKGDVYAPATIAYPADVLTGFLQVSLVRGFTLSGVKVEPMRPPYTFARVLAIDPGSVTLQYNASVYPFHLPNGSRIAYTSTATNVYGSLDPTTLLPVNPSYWGGGGAITLVNATTLRVDNSQVRLPATFLGGLLVLEHSREHTAVSLDSVAGVSISDVTLHGNAGFGFLVVRCTDVSLLRVNITSKDAPPPFGTLPPMTDPLGFLPMSIMADGIHISLCNGSMRIDSCRVERNGDDAFASNNRYYQVLSFPDPTDRTLVRVSGRDALDGVPGEPWLARSRLSLAMLAPSLTLQSVDFAGGRLRFSEPLPASVTEYDLLTSVAAPSSTVISNSVLWGNLGHGARVKIPNMTITDSLIGWNSYGAILGIPDASFWMSSLAVTDFALQRSRIVAGDPWVDAQYDVAAASIVITAYVPETLTPSPSGKQPLSAGTVNANITIVDNVIEQAPGVSVAILMRATHGYTVVNNSVSAPNSTSLQLVMPLNSDNGQVHNNTCTGPTGPVACLAG
jgi:hypothetical protein